MNREDTTQFVFVMDHHSTPQSVQIAVKSTTIQSVSWKLVFAENTHQW